MNPGTGKDMYLGLGCGIFLVLLVAFIVGVPLRDLGIWAIVFVALAFIFIQIVNRRNRRS